MMVKYFPENFFFNSQRGRRKLYVKVQLKKNEIDAFNNKFDDDIPQIRVGERLYKHKECIFNSAKVK